MAGLFIAKPPTVEPETLKLKVPCEGRDKDTIIMTIKNPCDERVTYKITGSRMDQFNLPTGPMGFIEPKATSKVELVPKKLKKANGFTKFDHFQVVCGVAPKGDMWTPDEVWRNKPKDTKTYKINLKVTDGKDEPEAGEASGSGEESGESSSGSEG